MEPVFELQMQVRDYECDIQGIVNNAVYQNYLEHGRHVFFKTIGVSFVGMHNMGIEAVVVRTELEYKHSLVPGDCFVIRLGFEKVGHVRYAFMQNIYRLSDNILCLKAKTICVLVQNGKPIFPTIIDDALKGYLKE